MQLIPNLCVTLNDATSCKFAVFYYIINVQGASVNKFYMSGLRNCKRFFHHICSATEEDSCHILSDVVPRRSASARGCLEADFYCLGLGLGLGLQCLGLGLGLEGWCLGLGLVTRPRPRH